MVKIIDVLFVRFATLFALLVASNVEASPKVKRRNETYPISGSSLQELQQMINRHGPINNDDGKRYDGITEWSLTWDYQLKRRGKVWIVANRNVQLNLKVITPRWTDFQNTPGVIRTQWRIYQANLLRHEEGHVRIALRAAQAIDKYLGVCGASSSLNKLKSDIQRKTNALLKQYRKIDQNYDQRTRHGATQGVSLIRPPAN